MIQLCNSFSHVTLIKYYYYYYLIVNLDDEVENNNCHYHDNYYQDNDDEDNNETGKVRGSWVKGGGRGSLNLDES